ncbi:MAG: hypothetical protein WAT74_00010 [Flavobacteriales bacterium]
MGYHRTPSYFIAFVALLSLTSLRAQNVKELAFPREITFQGGPQGIALLQGKPFTGLLVEEKTNTRLGEFRNGKRQGVHIQLWPNGSKGHEGEYVDNRKEGAHTQWHQNGTKRVTYSYASGVIADGSYTIYGADGRKEAVESFQSGQLSRIGTYKGDDLFEEAKDLHPGGTTKSREGLLKNGKKEGLWVEWYENGQKKSEETYVDGRLSGIATIWWPNGERKREAQYFDGELSKILYTNDVPPEESLFGMKTSSTIAYIATKCIDHDTLIILVDFPSRHNNTGHSAELLREIQEEILSGLGRRLERCDGNMLMRYGRKRVTHTVEFSSPRVVPVYDDGKVVTETKLGTITTQNQPGYRAKSSVRIRIVESATGSVIIDKEVAMVSDVYPTRDSAMIAGPTVLKGIASNYAYHAFRLWVDVVDVLEFDRKGNPKRLRIACGEEHSLGKGFTFDIVRSDSWFMRPLARVEVRETTQGYSECVVRDGEEQLKTSLQGHGKLMAISSYKL